MIKKCFDCRKEFEAETDNEIFCEKCIDQEHKISTGVLKIYDKI
jgi:Zn finger protein HypA/HybF involved in hydrogenase expression